MATILPLNKALFAKTRITDPQLWQFFDSLTNFANTQINATSSANTNVPGSLGQAYWVRVDPFTITPANLGDFVRISSSAKGAQKAVELRFEDPFGAIFSYDYGSQNYDYLILDGKALSLNGVSLGPVGLGILPDTLNLDTWFQIAACDSENHGRKRANVRFNVAQEGLNTPVDGSFEYIKNILYYTVGTTRYQIAPNKNPITRSIISTFDGSGATLTTGVSVPFICPYGFTLKNWNICVDTGTCTFKVWKKSNGTAIPTSSDSINTSGISISTGTAITSTTLSDFTNTTFNEGDIYIIQLSAVSSATQASVSLGGS